MKFLWYIASPISHPDPEVVRWRHEQVCCLQRSMLMDGVMGYFPHIHHRETGQYFPPGWEWWSRPSFLMLDRCDGLAVYQLPGWVNSVGVRAELERALVRDIPVVAIQMEQEVLAIQMMMSYDG